MVEHWNNILLLTNTIHQVLITMEEIGRLLRQIYFLNKFTWLYLYGKNSYILKSSVTSALEQKCSHIQVLIMFETLEGCLR